jgi:hypothetical protein
MSPAEIAAASRRFEEGSFTVTPVQVEITAISRPTSAMNPFALLRPARLLPQSRQSIWSYGGSSRASGSCTESWRAHDYPYRPNSTSRRLVCASGIHFCPAADAMRSPGWQGEQRRRHRRGKRNWQSSCPLVASRGHRFKEPREVFGSSERGCHVVPT